GVAGLVVGLAARPMLSNLIAGIQIATTQPIRIDDQVIVENEWGRIEEITSTYVVIRLWDLRRLIVPLSYFIEKPFQNWTRENTNLLGVRRLHRADRLDPRQADGDREGLQAVGRAGRAAAGDRRQGEFDRAAGTGERSLGRRGLRPALRDPRAADRVPAEGAPKRAAARPAGGRGQPPECGSRRASGGARCPRRSTLIGV